MMSSPPTSPWPWETKYPPEAWKRIKWEGAYLALVLLLGILVLVLVGWPALAEKTKILLAAALGGIFGNWIYSIKWYVRVVGRGQWLSDRIAWRLATPFIGVLLAVSTYIIVDSGLMGVIIARRPGVDEKFYAYAIGFLVGLFSDEVMGKLAEVARTVFGKTPPTEIP